MVLYNTIFSDMLSLLHGFIKNMKKDIWECYYFFFSNFGIAKLNLIVLELSVSVLQFSFEASRDGFG